MKAEVFNTVADDPNQCPPCGRFRFQGVCDQTRLRVNEQERPSTVTEVFVDLVYIFVLQAMLSGGVNNWTDLGHFVLTYATMFNSWLGFAFYNTRYDQEDILSQFLSLVAMLAVIGMASSIQLSWSNEATMQDGLTRFSVFYVKYCRTVLSQHNSVIGIKKMNLMYITGFGLACLSWIGVALFHYWPLRFVCIAIGFTTDYGTPFVIALIPNLMVRVHPTHITERFRCITQMAFAGCLFMFVGKITQMPQADIGQVLRAGALGLLLVFPLQLLHSRDPGPDVNMFELGTLAKLSTYAWLYLHMPLTMAIMLIGDCLANGIDIKDIEFSTGYESWNRTKLALSACIFHVLLVCIHALSTPIVSTLDRPKRCVTRGIFALVLLSSALTQWDACTMLSFISAIGAVEIILDCLCVDYHCGEIMTQTTVINPPRHVHGSEEQPLYGAVSTNL